MCAPLLLFSTRSRTPHGELCTVPASENRRCSRNNVCYSIHRGEYIKILNWKCSEKLLRAENDPLLKGLLWCVQAYWFSRECRDTGETSDKNCEPGLGAEKGNKSPKKTDERTKSRMRDEMWTACSVKKKKISRKSGTKETKKMKVKMSVLSTQSR